MTERVPCFGHFSGNASASDLCSPSEVAEVARQNHLLLEKGENTVWVMRPWLYFLKTSAIA